MARPRKRVRLARSQRAAGSQYFDRGLLLDSIEALHVDPDFVPQDVDDVDSDEETCDLVGEFSLLADEMEEESDDEALDDEDLAEKFAQREEAAVGEAVELAKEFWKKTLDQVCHVKNIK